jgi:hypothetical protein
MCSSFKLEQSSPTRTKTGSNDEVDVEDAAPDFFSVTDEDIFALSAGSSRDSLTDIGGRLPLNRRRTL